MKDEPGAHPSSVPRGLAVALGLAGTLYVLLALRASFLIDDAFISFRYARNWANGLGLVFNPGEAHPVEGYSNFLWVCALALLAKAQLALPLVARVISVAAGLATLLLVARTLRRDAGLSAATTVAGAVALATLPPFFVWSTGGLETACFTALLFWAFARLVRPRAEPLARLAPLATGAIGLALALTRAEGVLWVGGLALTALVARAAEPRGRADAVRHVRGFLLVAFVGFGAFLAWRRATYGEWVPNTVHAKAGLSPEVAARGARTVASWMLAFVWPLLALVAVPFARARGTALAAASMVLGGVAYNVLVGGDWMPMFRFLAPVSPFAAVCFAASLERLATGPRIAVCALSVAVALLPAWGASLVPRPALESLAFRTFRGKHQSEWERLQKARENADGYAALGRALRQIARPGDTMVCGPIGSIGFYSDLTLLDRNGLVNREIARREVDSLGAAAGHDKRVPRSWFLDDDPTFFEAAIVKARVPSDLKKPRFRSAALQFGKAIFAEPGEGPLAARSVVAARPLLAAEGLEPGWTLLVLEPADPQTARAFWAAVGL